MEKKGVGNEYCPASDESVHTGSAHLCNLGICY